MASLGAELAVHEPSQCKGAPCPFHAPSEHLMADWPITVRHDKSCLVERICPHGVGHPDPDSMAWLQRGGYGRRRISAVLGDRLGDVVEVRLVDDGPAPLMDAAEADAHAVHGCDGCCRG